MPCDRVNRSAGELSNHIDLSKEREDLIRHYHRKVNLCAQTNTVSHILLTKTWCPTYPAHSRRTEFGAVCQLQYLCDRLVISSAYHIEYSM
jgi:hypothetical protein